MHTGTKITTGKLYMQSKDSDEIVEVGSAAELKVDYDQIPIDELNSIAFGAPSSVMSLTVSKQDIHKLKRALFMHRVWYRKKKGKRYNLTYRYESIFGNNKQWKQVKKHFKKWQKRYSKKYFIGRIK